MFTPLRRKDKEGGGAAPLQIPPAKGTSPLDPVKMPHILYLIQSKFAIILQAVFQNAPLPLQLTMQMCYTQ